MRRSELVGGALWLALLFALGFFPGFGGPSYAYGLVSGVLIGPVAALFASARVCARSYAPGQAANFGLATGAAVFVAVLVVAVVHGLRLGFCSPGDDFLRLVLGPGLGGLCGGLWGAWVGVLVPRRRCSAVLRVVFALALPAGSYLASGVRFYTSPMVFAFDHFVGYFAGTLYDTELGSLDRLWTYRLETLGLLTFGVCFLRVLHRGEDGLEFDWRTGGGALSAAGLGLLLALGIVVNGAQLGHYQTTQSIVEALGNRALAQRCEVVYASNIARKDAHLLARECDAHVAQIERFFEVTGPKMVRVYLFASADQKAALMGARHVYVAKPWREEIYLQPNGFPHPVLGHELAHVIAGVFAPGPFHVAGYASGLIPDPGRIEGLAVAAAPSEYDSLTLRQWAAAMRRLELLPPLKDLFQLGFFGSNSSTAYTVAGAFMEWLSQQYGVKALRQWYAGDSLMQATGKSLSELETGFHQALDQVAISDVELAVAKARFDQPAVLARRCPHQVDAALSEGIELVSRGNANAAREVLQRVLAMDPSALRAQLELGRCERLDGRLDLAEATYRDTAKSGYASTLFQAAALELAGDMAWLRGQRAEADLAYQQAQALTVDEDRLRNLDVKRVGATSDDERARIAIRALFFGADGDGANAVLTGELLGRWAQAQNSPLAEYLLGKQYLGSSEWELAAQALSRALDGKIDSARVRQEALRGVLVSACALGASASVERTWEEISRQPGLPVARKFAMARFARRCGASVDVQ